MERMRSAALRAATVFPERIIEEVKAVNPVNICIYAFPVMSWSMQNVLCVWGQTIIIEPDITLSTFCQTSLIATISMHLELARFIKCFFFISQLSLSSEVLRSCIYRRLCIIYFSGVYCLYSIVTNCYKLAFQFLWSIMFAVYISPCLEQNLFLVTGSV